MTERATMRIGGMHCASCARLIELSLEVEDSVESIVVDYPSSTAAVEFDPARTTLGSLKETIIDLGYQVSDENRE